MTIFQASQALSREIHLDKLLATLLKAIFANAGANKGVLILVQENNLTIEAIAEAEKEPEVLLELPIEDSSAIPLSLIYQVKRTQETIIIADARQETWLTTDDYFIQQQTQSVLCTPILQQGKLLGILYLENNFTIKAFSGDRLEVIDLLCTQAAISLENARLYQQSQTYAQQLEQSLEKLKTSQARFQRLADNVPGVIYQFKIAATGEWQMPYFSPGATEMFELSAEEAMADAAVIINMLHPEDKTEFERSIALSAQTLTSWQWNGRFVLPSGQIKWIQGKSRPEKQSNGDLLWDGLLFDITERKQAEESLKQQLAAIEASVDGIGILKSDVYTYLNKSHLTTFGYDRIEELIGQNWKELYYPEEIERFESEIFPLLERDRYWTGEAIAKKKDGTTFPEELSLTLIDENHLIYICRDISDRKRLEAEQQRLLDVLEATPDYIGVASDRGEIVWHNKRMRELRQDLTIHKHISECHPAWVNEIILNRALPTAIEFGSWSGEVTLLDENGREIPVSQVIIAHKSKSGAVEYFSTVMRDITERKQYEQQLQGLSERLELAIQSAQIGIWEWDYLSNRLSWDDRMFAIYGIQAEDFRHTHQDWEKYVHPDDLADAQTYLVDTGNRFTREFRIIRNDGAIRHIFSTAMIQKDERGQLIRAVGVNIDISDRKQAELALAEQQAELLALFDAMQDVIVVLDANGQYLKVAPTGTHLLYKPAPDLVGKTLAEVLPSETASYFLSEIYKVLANKELSRIEYSLTIVDREIWFEASIVPLTDTSVVWFARDISDRKQAEQLLEEYNQTLEREVAERTEQLSQTLEELKLTQDQLIESKKMAALGTLVAGVAHEVNTPVGTSITVASTLADRTKTLIAQVERGELKRSDLDKYLNLTCECNQIILTNLHRAADLVQTFKQVAVDTNDLECRSIFLIAYLEEIVFSLTPHFRPLGHKITITGDDKLEIVTHPGSLAQAIANLSLNSIEHAYDDRKFGHLKFEVLQQKESVIIEYSDDGCGISPENLKHIFEPFFTTARNRGGTGLGLHIVYNLITQKLQGKIEVESQVDRGTKFRLTLPLKLFDT
jgi:PAS domain S-box-containing protein